MSLLNLEIETNLTVPTLTRDYQKSVSAKYPVVQALSQLLQSILSGNQPGTPPSVTVTAYASDNFATGSFGLVSVVATNTLTINSVTFTATNSGSPSTNEFTVGLSDSATAVNLAAAINASPTALVLGRSLSVWSGRESHGVGPGTSRQSDGYRFGAIDNPCFGSSPYGWGSRHGRKSLHVLRGTDERSTYYCRTDV